MELQVRELTKQVRDLVAECKQLTERVNLQNADSGSETQKSVNSLH